MQRTDEPWPPSAAVAATVPPLTLRSKRPASPSGTRSLTTVTVRLRVLVIVQVTSAVSAFRARLVPLVLCPFVQAIWLE